MNGQKIIQRIKKSAICFKKKANEMIDWLNTPWEVTLPDDQFGVGQVTYGENKFTIDLSQLSTIEVTACDPSTGESKTLVLLGYWKNEL